MSFFDKLPAELVDIIIDKLDDFKDRIVFSSTARCFKKYKPEGYEFGKFLLMRSLSDGYKNKKDIGFKVRYPAYNGMRMTKYMRIVGSFLSMSTTMYFMQNKTSLVSLVDISRVDDKSAYFMDCLDNFDLDDAVIWDLKIKPWKVNEDHKDLIKAISLIRKKEAEEGEYGFISHHFDCFA